jgi:hypothetical protein
MDNNTLTTAGLATTFTVAIGILYKIYMAVNHKRIRSNCCGKKIEASLDIEDTTPPLQGGFKRSSPELKSQEESQKQIYVKTTPVIPILNLGGNKENIIENPMRPSILMP